MRLAFLRCCARLARCTAACMRCGTQVIATPAGVTVTSNKDPEHTMRAVTWQGPRKIVVEERLRPKVTDPVSGRSACSLDDPLSCSSGDEEQRARGLPRTTVTRAARERAHATRPPCH